MSVMRRLWFLIICLALFQKAFMDSTSEGQLLHLLSFEFLITREESSGLSLWSFRNVSFLCASTWCC